MILRVVRRVSGPFGSAARREANVWRRAQRPHGTLSASVRAGTASSEQMWQRRRAGHWRPAEPTGAAAAVPHASVRRVRAHLPGDGTAIVKRVREISSNWCA